MEFFWCNGGFFVDCGGMGLSIRLDENDDIEECKKCYDFDNEFENDDFW